MPRRPRGRPARPHGDARSIRQGEDAAGEVARAGRTGERGSQTHLTGEPGAVPDGPATRIKRDEDPEVRRSLEMENSAAVVLADQGYQVKQNPTKDEVARARQDAGDTGRPTSNPDYLIEGRVFDCYSPTKPTKSVRGIWSEVEEKVLDDQTQRVVVNLQDWRGDITALHKQFADWPIANLKEVKAVTQDGDIVQISLPGTDN